MSAGQDSPKRGTQSIRRALQCLRLLAEHEPHGLTLKEMTTLTGMERSTAYRLMDCLVSENFARRDSAGKRYALGVDAMQLGFSAMHSPPVVEAIKPLVKQLCRLSGDTVFLVIQQGDYSLCLWREHGIFPVRIFTIDVGEKRLMGIGAGGLALIADYDDAAIADIYARHHDTYQQAGLPLDILMKHVRATRDNGYSEIIDGITPGVSGVGYAFRLSDFSKIAVSFGAISPRLDATRRKAMGELLKEACGNWANNIPHRFAAHQREKK